MQAKIEVLWRAKVELSHGVFWVANLFVNHVPNNFSEMFLYGRKVGVSVYGVNIPG